MKYKVQILNCEMPAVWVYLHDGPFTLSDPMTPDEAREFATILTQCADEIDAAREITA